MKKNKNKLNLKKIIAYIFGTIVLGGISSAFSDIFIKPYYFKSVDVLINIVTLGIESIKTNLFKEIARGFHENVSMQILIITYTFVLLLPMILITLFYLNKKINKKSISLFKKTFEKNTQKIELFIILYSAFFSIFFFFEFFKIAFINHSVTHYNHLYNVVAPYIENHERLKIKSKFALIKNENDYKNVILMLEEVAKKENLEIPKNIF